MLKFFGKIVCFFKGHIEWDGIAAISIGHPTQLGSKYISVEYCVRCQTLWGNPHNTIQEKIDLVSSSLKKAFDTHTHTVATPKMCSIEADFVLDELTDELIRVHVENSSLNDTEVEVECENGKIVAYTLDFESRTSYSAEEVECIREQIGNVLNKIEKPVKIKVSQRVFDIFDFDFGKGKGVVGISSTLARADHKHGIQGYGISGTAPSGHFYGSGGVFGKGISTVKTPTQSPHSQGTVCDQGENLKGVSGSGSGH